MKKITKILSLTTIVAGMVTPAILISTNSNNINIDQQINSVDANETIETNNIASDTTTDDKNDNLVVNNEKNGSIVTRIDSDQCDVEGTKATDWMGITAGTGLVNFEIDDGSLTAIVTYGTSQTIVSSSLKIPSSITYDSKAYNVTTINSYAFEYCSSLTGLDLSNAVNLITISNQAFQGCSSLTGTLTIPANVTSIGDYAFSGAKFVSFDVDPANTKFSKADNLGSNCQAIINNITGKFGNDSSVVANLCAGELIIPNTLTSIGASAFQNCSGLTSLDLSNAKSLLTIGASAFQNCSGLTGTLTIPASVTTIHGDAFGDTNYTNVYFSTPTPPATLGLNIFGFSLSTIKINVPKGAKVAWDATPDILTKLGIVNLSQIVEPITPPTNITINVNTNQTMKKGESLTINPTVTLDPIDADNDLNWSIIDSISEVIIDSKTGKITYKPNTIGSKQLKLHVQSVLVPSVFADATINIEVIEPTPPGPDPVEPTNDFPVWAYLVIIGAVTVLVSAITITIVTINRKNKGE